MNVAQQPSDRRTLASISGEWFWQRNRLPEYQVGRQDCVEHSAGPPPFPGCCVRL